MKDLIIQNITTWDKLKLNYWGIPKSGNSSVKKKLIEVSFKDSYINDAVYNYEHQIYHDIKNCKYIDKEEAITNGFTNFTLVRNPYSRFNSMFKDLKKRGNEYFLVTEKVKNINDFLFFLETIDPKYLNYHFKSQAFFVAIEERKLAVQNIFKIEEIQKLEEFLNLGKFDTVNKIDEEIFLTDNQKEKVYNIFHKDFKYFGYKQ